MLVTVLEKNGLMVSDINDFSTETKGNSIILRGNLSTMAFNQVTSLIEHPISHGVDSAVTGKADDSQVDVGRNSKMYYDSIMEYVTEMYDRKGSSLDSRSSWFEKYARQMDGLSTVNVDPDVVNFGSFVSHSFRDMTSKLRQMDMRRYENQVRYGANYDNATDNYNYNNYYYGYAYRYSKYTTERVKGSRQLNNESIKKMKTEVDQSRLDIDNRSADLRRKMSSKYKINF